MEWKGIGFDLDNTLFSHEKAFKKAIEDSYYTYCEHVQISKQQVPFGTFFPLFKRNSDKYWNLFEEKKIDGTTYRRLRFNETMKTLQLPYGDHLSDFFHSYYYDIVYEYSQPFGKLDELMTFLINEQIKVFIITNGTIDTQYKKIEKLRLHEKIKKEHIFVSEELGISKPDKEVFQLVERRLKLNANELLFIGDSWMHDVVGALNAGWDAIFLNSRNEESSTSHTPLCEVNTLSDVYDFLRSVYERRGTS